MTAAPPARPARPVLGVLDEISPLRSVIVHTPGPEIDRLTPDTRERFLFDEVLWGDRARAQHEDFITLLEGEGAEVLRLADLLRDVLADPAAREELLEGTLDPWVLGDMAAADLRAAFRALDPDRLLTILLGGITVGELRALGVAPRSLALQLAAEDDMVLDPLPNHLFTRDPSAWIGDTAVLSPMRRGARRRESLHLEAVYRHHPRFAGTGEGAGAGSTGLRRVHAPGHGGGRATLEGGDVMVLSPRTVAVGLSERTSAVGVEHLAAALLEDAARGEGTVERVVAIALPHRRSMMHLDTVTTVVDHESMLRYGPLGPLETIEIEHGPGGLVTRAHPAGEMDAVLARGMGVDALRVITPPLGPTAAAREQWDDGCNVLAVAPGRVVAYARASATNDHLRSLGIEVLELDGDELGRGRGGPRCMSCPVSRG